MILPINITQFQSYSILNKLSRSLFWVNLSWHTIFDPHLCPFILSIYMIHLKFSNVPYMNNIFCEYHLDLHYVWRSVNFWLTLNKLSQMHFLHSHEWSPNTTHIKWFFHMLKENSCTSMTMFLLATHVIYNWQLSC